MNTLPVHNDRAAILKACGLLFEPGQVIEVRGLDAVTRAWRKPHTVSGYFDDWEKLADAAVNLQARGIYVTLNPVNPALLARAHNRLRDLGAGDPATGDGDILRRRWLLVDCDPVRPAGISATDQEHTLALARAAEIHAWLTAQGWPEPLCADSGNGGHLLYRVDLPVDDDGLIKRVLTGLAFRFDDALVTVDVKNFNPSRVCKLYGTWGRKGDDTPDRSHRLSRLREDL
jgi:hypothetical protein